MRAADPGGHDPGPGRRRYARQRAHRARTAAGHARRLGGGAAWLAGRAATSDGTGGADGAPGRPGGLSPQAHAALRDAIARLAVGFLSGPGGLASALRTSLLGAPYNSPSLPLDIGYSENIPARIPRA